MELIAGLIKVVDPKILYIAGAILAISSIVAFIKKAVKLAIVVVIIAVAVSLLGPMVKNIQQKYDFNVVDEVKTVRVN